MNNSVKISSEIMQIDEVNLVNSVIKSPHATMSVISYEIDGILIDTGSQSMKHEFRAFIDQMDFDQVMLTHFHEDHTGNAAYIQEKYGVPIYIHQMSQHLTEKEQRIPLYRKFVWGEVETFTSKILPKTFTSRNHAWEVIETPGHAADHVAFYNQTQGMLFTGDLFVTPRPKVVLVDENVLDTLDSLKKIKEYDFDKMFCCHAGLVKNPHKMIQMKIDYLEHIQGKVLDLQKEGKDVYEITNEIFDKPYPIIEASNSEWSAVHMVRNFLNRG